MDHYVSKSIPELVVTPLTEKDYFGWYKNKVNVIGENLVV